MRSIPTLRANVAAGLVAAVIYMIIDAVTGDSLGGVVIGGLVIGLATFAVAYVISRLMGARRGPSAD